ncbi:MULTISPECIES: FtsB family cell division protein [Desulfosediminicola]|uniref:FtsB family cell division protein n=1 Tax=Desulfosediminicola TaxID=2886823 RepID=UPI0010AD62AA|nr:septum formation initiator family protein [Desulfosediminicola ganghwensis]
MKRNPVNRKSPPYLQNSQLKKMAVVMTLFALLWIVFAPQSGVMALLKKRAEVKNLESETEAIARENKRMEAEIGRLENDRVYLEEVARRDYDMLKPNERVYDFSKPAQAKKR